ncbi:MAG: hypothetical protein KAY24_05535, partial [Candidatus Eisenbacteria sp.]|nr:hypothetical protein [Candidatus Eisenbacteria bacterium]
MAVGEENITRGDELFTSLIKSFPHATQSTPIIITRVFNVNNLDFGQIMSQISTRGSAYPCLNTKNAPNKRPSPLWRANRLIKPGSSMHNSQSPPSLSFRCENRFSTPVGLVATPSII